LATKSSDSRKDGRLKTLGFHSNSPFGEKQRKNSPTKENAAPYESCHTQKEKCTLPKRQEIAVFKFSSQDFGAQCRLKMEALRE
jgi:hypothetical protein